MIGRSVLAALAAVHLILAPAVAAGQAKPAGAGFSPERLKRVDAVLDRYVADGSVAGSVTLVHRKGRLAYVAVRGYQDLESRTPMRRDSLFALASMTKPLTAVAVMMLVEDGKLRLDDPVDRWLPELADRKVLVDPAGPLDNVRPPPRPITVRDLLTYRMGIGVIGYAGLPADSPIGKAYAAAEDRALTQDAYMARLGALPLVYPPGERFMYNAPSAVAGILVSRVAGMPFDRFLETRVFRPLGMKDTAFHVPPEKRSRLARTYQAGPQPGTLVPVDRPAPSAPPAFPNGAGGLFSTADDYLTFARMMLGKGELNGVRILSRPSVELMTRDYMTSEAPQSFFINKGFFAESGFGLGLQVQIRQSGLGPAPGAYWWPGLGGVMWTADPREEMVFVRLVQRFGQLPHFNGDFATALYQAIDD